MKWYLMALENSDFEGRARRKEFWMFSLIDTFIKLLFNVFFIFLEEFFNASIFNSELFMTILIFYMLYILILIPPSIAVSIRRLHDTNRNGYWWFISFVPFVGPIVFLVFMCLDGHKEENKYGVSPKYK